MFHNFGRITEQSRQRILRKNKQFESDIVEWTEAKNLVGIKPPKYFSYYNIIYTFRHTLRPAYTLREQNTNQLIFTPNLEHTDSNGIYFLK